MSGRGWAAVMGFCLVVALIFGFPYSCGVPDCGIGVTDCPATCTNLMGMAFEGGPPAPLVPVLVVIAIGLAVGALAGLAITKLRSMHSK